MGKRKRRAICAIEGQQKSTEVGHLNEQPTEQRLNAAKTSTNDSIEPSNQQQTSSSEATNSVQSGPPKKVRKHTRLQDIWDLEGYRIQVTFDETGQPVGEEGNDLTNFLGTLVKMPQHLSLEFLDWRKVPKDKKDDLWSIVKEKFEILPAETKEIRKWILSDMGTKFKSWKYELKKKWYDKVSTVDDIVDAQNDSRVDKTQFKKLVTHWFNQKTEVISETKKKIRSMHNEPHVTGTKSFARLTHEERKKNNGVRPSRGTIYRISRTRKDGTIVNKVAATVVDSLNSSTCGSTSSTEAGVVDYKNDDLAKIKGPEKGGRVRCLGKVVMVKDKGSCFSQDPQVPQLKSRINELEDEMKEMKETKEKQEIEMKEMKAIQETMVRFLAIVKDQLPDASLHKIFNGLNTQVSNDSCSSYNLCSNGNPTSSHASHSRSFG